MGRKLHPQSGGREGTLTIIQDDQQRGQQVTHALDVADLNVLPDVAVRHTGRPVMAPTVCLSNPLLLSSHPALVPHLSPGPTPPASCLDFHPQAHSLQAAYAQSPG